MAIQLSVFVENRPGKLEAITKILAESKINIRGIKLASEGEFGVVRIIVNDPNKAYRILKENHFTVSKRNIIIVLIEDKPGGLHDMLVLLSSNNINVEDCYGVVLEQDQKAAIIIEVAKIPEAENILKSNNITILTDKDVL